MWTRQAPPLEASKGTARYVWMYRKRAYRTQRIFPDTHGRNEGREKSMILIFEQDKGKRYSAIQVCDREQTRTQSPKYLTLMLIK